MARFSLRGDRTSPFKFNQRSRFGPWTPGSPSHQYRNGVVRILNLSFEHRVRIGLLLSDGTMQVSLLDQEVFRWIPKGLVLATFDRCSPESVVYSRTADALFWPQRNESGTWDVEMCSVERRVQKTVIRNLPEFELQTLRDELVVLFRKHGVMFVEYRQLSDSRNYRYYGSHFRSGLNLVQTPVKQQRPLTVADVTRRLSFDLATDLPDDISLDGISIDRSPAKDSSYFSSNEDYDDEEEEDTPLAASYWSPEKSCSYRVALDEQFSLAETRSELKAFCHCKDTPSLPRKLTVKEIKEVPIKTVVLYGNILFKLTAHSCTPLMTIEVPSEFKGRPLSGPSSFRLMYLGRIVVIYDGNCIAGYFNSTQPVKIRRGKYLHAGYGIVCDTEGIFRIKMSEPRVKAFQELYGTAED